MKEYEAIAKQIKKASMNLSFPVFVIYFVSVDKEAKDKVQKEAAKATRDKKLIEYRKVWLEDIIPNWEKKYGINSYLVHVLHII